MAGYKNIQNKALRQGTRVFHFILDGIVYTSNGHVMVADEIGTDEFKPLKSQYDLRSDEPPVIINDKFEAQFKKLKPVTITNHMEPVNGGLVCVVADGKFYQSVYVEFIMAKYDVDEWKMGNLIISNALVAVDQHNNIIGAIAPVENKEKEDVEQK